MKAKKAASITLFLAIIIILIWQAPTIITSLSTTKLTLPIGTFVGYGENQNQGYEYTFRYGGLLADKPNLLQVWTTSGAFPKELKVTKDLKQTAFAIEITVTEINEEYLVISVKRLT